MNRARLTAFQTIRREVAGKPVSYGILSLHMPDGGTHQFDIVSGPFGRGPIPGLGEDLHSADHTRFGRQDIHAIYAITEMQEPKPQRGTTVPGASFFLRLASPPDALTNGHQRGRTAQQIAHGLKQDALGIHPDGHTDRDYYGPHRPAHGPDNDGTNGCLGISAAEAPRFLQLWHQLARTHQQPTALYILEAPAVLHTPHGQALANAHAAFAFPNVGR